MVEAVALPDVNADAMKISKSQASAIVIKHGDSSDRLTVTVLTVIRYAKWPMAVALAWLLGSWWWLLVGLLPVGRYFQEYSTNRAFGILESDPQLLEHYVREGAVMKDDEHLALRDGRFVIEGSDADVEDIGSPSPAENGDIIEAYGAVLERRQGMAGRASTLPYPKHIIRDALVQELANPTHPSDLIKAMENVFVELESFLPDAEWEIASNFDATIASFDPSEGGPTDSC